MTLVFHYYDFSIPQCNAFPVDRRDALREKEAAVRVGEKVRLRMKSPVAREWGISSPVEGVIMCQYRILARGAPAPDRLDVRLATGNVIWGGAEADFEPCEPEGRLN